MRPSNNPENNLPTIRPVGWNTWDVRHLNAVCHLPSRVEVLFSLQNTKCEQVRDVFDWRTGMHRLGPHATDGSYCELELRWEDSVVRFEYASHGDLLICRISPLAAKQGDQLNLQVTCQGAWNTPVEVVRHAAGLHVNRNGTSWWVDSPNPCGTVGMLPRLDILLDRTVLVRTVPGDPALPSPSSLELNSFVDRQRSTCLASSLRSEGWLDGAADGLTRAISWNTIWEPTKGRICTPVSRDWCKGQFFGSYVLFDWDTFFCATMANLEDPAVAHANVHAILQEVTSRGFVPNFGCELGASEDRSQPPVGAYCVLKLYRAASLSGHEPALQLLETTYPALVRWHEWWYTHRDGNGDGLLEWGSDPLPGLKEWLCDNMQAAMYESGLDNSPMYDGIQFNPQAHTMELADVGLNSLYAMDAWALGQIAVELGLPDAADQFRAEYQQLANRINTELWDEAEGIYKNKRWDGQLSAHLSPTNFYPLIAGVATPDRARRLVHEHLLNEKEFWGTYVIPSTARNDPGFGGNDYWRGRIWGPMNFLVSEGLHRYGFDAVSHEFARRSLDLFNREWQVESHVHENYNTHSGDGDDVPSSDPVYTWGALLAYIAIQELVDVEPWGSWRFGNLVSESASVTGIRTREGMLDVISGPDGLSVLLNHELLIHCTPQAIVSAFTLTSNGINFHVRTEGPASPVQLLLGHLPVCQKVIVVDQGMKRDQVTSSSGQLMIASVAPTSVNVSWE